MGKAWHMAPTSRQSNMDSFLLMQCFGALPPHLFQEASPEYFSLSMSPALRGLPRTSACTPHWEPPVPGSPHSLLPVCPSAFEGRTQRVPSTKWPKGSCRSSHSTHFTHLLRVFQPLVYFVPHASVSTSLGLCLQGGGESSCTHSPESIQLLPGRLPAIE